MEPSLDDRVTQLSAQLATATAINRANELRIANLELLHANSSQGEYIKYLY